MISTDEVRTLLHQNGAVVDADGDKIGKIGQVYLDDETGQPEWVTVTTGLFGTSETFVPLREATLAGEDIRVPYEKSQVKDAPRIDATDGHLSADQEVELYSFYGLTYSGSTGPAADGPAADDAMTSSEERLDAGTEPVVSGRARLRKYVVTENVTTTVPVSHEEVRLEREPITGADRDQVLAGGELTSEEQVRE